MSDQPDPPNPTTRPLTSLPVAPHGHQIQPSHRTVLPGESHAAEEGLAAILATWDEAPPADQLAQLSRLCGEHPAFLDGWARLAQAAYSSGDSVAAYAYSRVGYHRGLDRLRKSGWGGTGQVEWAEPSNRGFLRSLFMLMVAAASVGEEDEADRCHRFLLDLDPNDGIGVGTRRRVGVGQQLERAELP
ncbi:MAG: DUF3151 domain-containing protein [Candidatus Dormibacteria bacterium]